MKKLSLLFAALLTATVMNLKAADPVSYLYPEYNTSGDPTSGIKEWKTGSCTDYTVVADASSAVTWNAGWYVVNGADVKLTQGATCKGAVNLILADDAKLTVMRYEEDYAGINVSGNDNSLTIYGQAKQIGQLIAAGGELGAGIGGGIRGDGSNITINGGTVTATGGSGAAGIGGGFEGPGLYITINGGIVTATGGDGGAGIGGGQVGSGQGYGSYITINGGEITATGEDGAAGIGGGLFGTASYITIKGGTVTANGGSYWGNLGDGIGSGYSADTAASNIFVDPFVLLKAGSSANPTDVIAHATSTTDVASDLAGKRYATVETLAGPDMHDFLYFVGLNGNDTVRLNKMRASLAATFEYSKDRKTWLDYTWPDNSGKGGAAIELKNAGDTVFFRAKGTNGKNATMSTSNLFYFKFVFGNDDSIAAGGKIMSLYDASCEQDAMTAYGFCYLFYKAKQLVSTSELKLPATTLAESCYQNMFQGCAALTQAPELPATTLADHCYANMFKECTSLTQAPELKATKLENECYSNMFKDCAALTQAPELPATTLAASCYTTMFAGCSTLTKAPELKATKLERKCYYTMFARCTSLTQVPELNATTLADTCYTGMFQNCTSLEVNTFSSICDGVEFEPTTTGTAPTNWNQNMFKGCKGDATLTAEYGIQLGGHYCIKKYVPECKEIVENKTICYGESVSWRGQDCNETKAYHDTLRYKGTQYDSVHFTFNLKVTAEAIENIENKTIGYGESVSWRGQDCNETKAYYDTLRYDGTQCDSVHFTFNLTVLPKAYTRNVTNGNYGTICLAKAFSAADGVEGLYKPATQATDSSVLYCTEVLLSEVVAGESYIFKADSDAVVFTLAGTTIADPVVANNMLGNLGDTVTVDANFIAEHSDYAILGTPAGASEQQVVKLVEDSKLLPNCAMINLKTVPATGAPQAAPGRRMISFGRNVATGVEQVAGGRLQVAEKCMVNGQLIIIRDGKMFNAQGQEL